MLRWDIEQVAEFFSASPKHNENSSYEFDFEIHGLQSRLKVFPYTNEVQLYVFDHENQTELFAWLLQCQEIVLSVDDDNPGEEEGKCLAFHLLNANEIADAHQSVVIGRRKEDFSIMTVSMPCN